MFADDCGLIAVWWRIFITVQQTVVFGKVTDPAKARSEPSVSTLCFLLTTALLGREISVFLQHQILDKIHFYMNADH